MGGGAAGRSSGRNGTIFGSGFGGAGGAAAAAGFTGSAGGGVTGATRVGSGVISLGLGTMVGGCPGISAGFGLTIVAAGLTSIAVSSSASAGFAFFARAGFVIGVPSGPSSTGAFGFGTR